MLLQAPFNKIISVIADIYPIHSELSPNICKGACSHRSVQSIYKENQRPSKSPILFCVVLCDKWKTPLLSQSGCQVAMFGALPTSTPSPLLKLFLANKAMAVVGRGGPWLGRVKIGPAGRGRNRGQGIAGEDGSGSDACHILSPPSEASLHFFSLWTCSSEIADAGSKRPIEAHG